MKRKYLIPRNLELYPQPILMWNTLPKLCGSLIVLVDTRRLLIVVISIISVMGLRLIAER